MYWEKEMLDCGDNGIVCVGVWDCRLYEKGVDLLSVGMMWLLDLWKINERMEDWRIGICWW